jgi:hypothetical protein
MNIKAFKMTRLSIALAAAFLVAAGSSNAFAQGWQLQDRDGDGRVDSRREMVEERRGYDDGRIAGRRDALAHFSFYPAGSARYQRGGVDYRQGFQRGYAQAYRQSSNNYGYRNNDLYGPRDVYRNDQYRQGGYYDRSGNFHRY